MNSIFAKEAPELTLNTGVARDKSVGKATWKLAADMTPKVLHKTKWFEVRVKDGWEYLHNRKASSAVAILVFNEKKQEVLGRYESVPCHDVGHYLVGITGMMDKENEPKETAVRELKEEAGITAKPEELIDLGYLYPHKDSDYCILLFGLDGAKKKLGKATTDGSEAEKNAYVRWVPVKEAVASHAPTIGASLAKLAVLGVNLFKED
jgi:8-oxo-dGTP pyrophosphatase MutT (NUDIX family)